MSIKKDIGSVIKSAMETYKDTPDDLWIFIESQLKRRRRIKILMLLLSLLGVTAVGIIYINHTKNNPSSTKKTDQFYENSNNAKQEYEDIVNTNDSILSAIKSLTKNKENDDSPSNEIIPENLVNSKKNNPRKLESNPKNFLTSSRVFRLDPLMLTINSLELNKVTILHKNEEFKEKRILSVSPFISMDHYNAFGRSTSQQNTFNYGSYLYFYGSQNFALRLGFKKVNLQYTFKEMNTLKKQQITYSEIPIEARYFFNAEKKYKTSFITGISFMYAEDATLIDINNATSLGNKDFFQQVNDFF